jgi:hypothetical protein
MQHDGNLVESTVNKTGNKHVIWASYTSGGDGSYAVLQTDGNLVVKNSAGQVQYSPTWVRYGVPTFMERRACGRREGEARERPRRVAPPRMRDVQAVQFTDRQGDAGGLPSGSCVRHRLGGVRPGIDWHSDRAIARPSPLRGPQPPAPRTMRHVRPASSETPEIHSR